MSLAEKNIKAQIDLLAERLVAGGAANYGEYQLIVGKIHGCKTSLEELKKSKRNSNPDGDVDIE